MSLNWSHQKDLFDPAVARKVLLIGAGSVGSHVVYELAKMGVSEIEVWDHDSVQSHNVSMSLYGPGQVGLYKVDALRELICLLCGLELTVRQHEYAGEVLPRNCIVISCVDSMAVRKKIWKEVKGKVSVPLFLDTRVAGAYTELLTIVPVDKRDCGRYEALLFEDKDAVKRMCGQHGVVFAATRVAATLAATLAQFWQKGTKKWRVAERCDTLERAM